MEFGNVGFWGEGKTGVPGYIKTSRSKEENKQQTHPTYDAGSGNGTRATLVGCERSHHCAIPAPLEGETQTDNTKLTTRHFEKQTVWNSSVCKKQRNSVNTDTKGTCHSVRIIWVSVLSGLSEKTSGSTCFIDTKTKADGFMRKRLIS